MLTDYIIMPGDHYQAACDKIRERTGKTDMIRSGDMADEIDNIPRGMELPTIAEDVLGTASDLAEGKQLIDADGNIVTGEVKTYSTYGNPCTPEEVASLVSFNRQEDGPILIRDGYIDLQASLSKFGDATAADVVKGKTFTSSAGLKVEGEINLFLLYEGRHDFRDGEIHTYFKPIGDCVVRSGTQYAGAIINGDELGDATAADVAAGKTFTSTEGLKVTGTMEVSGGGLTVKSGTTTSGTINTGLSEIEEFFIYKESQSATGLIHLHYSKEGGTSYLYASAWSTMMYGSKTITNGTTVATVSGGSITLPSSTATSGGLSSGVTYKWIAVGTE